MAAGDLSQPYLNLANRLSAGDLAEADLKPQVAALPPLGAELLDRLVVRAEDLATGQPRDGWAVMQVVHQAVEIQDCDLLLRSRSAWYLARTCNHWAQPERMRAALAFARRGFAELQDAGWLAACDWQANALAWVQPNFAAAAVALHAALTGLENAGLSGFVPACRLALAYALILIGQHNAALDHIHGSQAAYRADGDELNEARCWLTEASSLRRQDRFDAALLKLEPALRVFQQHKARPDEARVHYQMGLGYLLQADDLALAHHHLERARDLFLASDLDLWHAMCVNNLGSVYLIQGRLKQAEAHYAAARVSFERHAVLGLLADNLNDSGKLNALLGRPLRSLEQLRQCVEVNERLGAPLSSAVAISNLGEAYGQMGRYQDALHHLERAIEMLEALQVHFRLATCEKYIAWIWSRLGQPERAHQYLDRSAAHYELADQRALLASVYNYRAAAYAQQAQPAKAIQALEHSLNLAERHGLRPQVALTKRLLGEALLAENQPAAALPMLQAAYADFVEMSMSMEEAASLLSIGRYYRLSAQPEEAQRAFEVALEVSEGAFPEVDWQAQLELGFLAEASGQPQSALSAYRLGVAALAGVRQNFLQPALAGAYFQAPGPAFDRIINAAATAGAPLDALDFIEAAKSSTLTRNLLLLPGAEPIDGSRELLDLRAEIELLKQDLRATLEDTSRLQTAIQTRESRERLRQKMRQYAEHLTRLERKRRPGPSPDPAAFQLEAFRKQAAAALGGHWLGLDYWLTGANLIILKVSPNNCSVTSQPVSQRFHLALAACDRARRQSEPPNASDLQYLGDVLLQPAIADLAPDTCLLVAPHRALHHVPWSALQPTGGTGPLVCLCTPCVVPSLSGLSGLWARRSSAETARSAGLLVGLSTFGGSHVDLPGVRREIAGLTPRISARGMVLVENEATWKNLLAQRSEQPANGLSRFAWLHLASHFIPDRTTGRLGGLALQDGDVWLDQLRDLAPLPSLVTLSACNSNDAFVFEGDERLDLPTTCWIAGADTVIGSSWLVPDESAAEVMIVFYDLYLSGLGPAAAAAQAQRQLIETGAQPAAWAGFVCAGVP